MQSITFQIGDSPAVWIVPEHVTRIHVEADGARGGAGGGNPGAQGGSAAADLFVCPGSELLIRIGGRGGANQLNLGGDGGENGGGSGGDSSLGIGSGGGGGMTSLQVDSLYALIAAGGGGSSPSNNGGVGGGLIGAQGGQNNGGLGGGPGSQLQGGIGGSSPVDSGTNGVQFAGGNGGDGNAVTEGGGGGGAGWFGGGGGGAGESITSPNGGGGGGGSSYGAEEFVIPGSFTTVPGGAPGPDGRLTISWTPVQPPQCKDQVVYKSKQCQPVYFDIGTDLPNARSIPPSGSRLSFGRHHVECLVDQCVMCEFTVCVKQARAPCIKRIH